MAGYARGARGYRLWDSLSEKMVLSRNVTFEENNESDWAFLVQNSNIFTLDRHNLEPVLTQTEDMNDVTPDELETEDDAPMGIEVDVAC